MLARRPCQPAERADRGGAGRRCLADCSSAAITLPLLQAGDRHHPCRPLRRRVPHLRRRLRADRSGPANATDVLSTFIYRQMFFDFDFAGGCGRLDPARPHYRAVASLACRRRSPRSRGCRRVDRRFVRTLGTTYASPRHRLRSLPHADPLDLLDLLQADGRDLRDPDDAPPAAPDARPLRRRAVRRLPRYLTQQPDRRGRGHGTRILLAVPAAFGLRQVPAIAARLAPLLHRRHPHLPTHRARAAVLPAVPDARA